MMNSKMIKILVCALFAALALTAFAGCTGDTENVSSIQSETSNPFGDSFSPTNPGDTSVGNAAGGLQEPPEYPSGYGC